MYINDQSRKPLLDNDTGQNYIGPGVLGWNAFVQNFSNIGVRKTHWNVSGLRNVLTRCFSLECVSQCEILAILSG